MIGEHAGYCIGGPWNGKQCADTRERIALYWFAALEDGPVTVPLVAVPRGEYRWRDGSWEWVVE